MTRRGTVATCPVLVRCGPRVAARLLDDDGSPVLSGGVREVGPLAGSTGNPTPRLAQTPHESTRTPLGRPYSLPRAAQPPFF